MLITAHEHRSPVQPPAQVLATTHTGPTPEPLRQHDPRNEALVVHGPTSPNANPEIALAHNLRRALGHSDETLGPLSVRSTLPHLRAHQIKHLIITGAHHLPPATLEQHLTALSSNGITCRPPLHQHGRRAAAAPAGPRRPLCSTRPQH